MTHSGASILLVEDDLRLAELVSRYLTSNGFDVHAVHSGGAVLTSVATLAPDLIILDLGLPDRDGLSVCKSLRPAYSIPILILTARDNDIDHVLGLELGADDYVIKPVEPRVLMARIHALLRRSSRPAAVEIQVLRFGRLVINIASRSITLDDKSIQLSASEFDLLVHLATQAGKIQSRESLFKHLYRREYDGMDRTLDIRISNIRRKLGDSADVSERIKTIWGQGYLFVPDEW